MYERLLVPLDGSELAEIALLYAEELARRLGSKVILVNVRGAAEKTDDHELREYLGKMVAKTEHDINKSPSPAPRQKVIVESVILGSSGSLNVPAEEILTYSEKENINLIVIATHGRTGIKRWALGSTAEKVVRASKSPVLLIKANTGIPKNVSMDKILVPLDGSKHSETILSHVESLASNLSAGVILFHVVVQPYKVYAGSLGVVEVLYTTKELRSIEAGTEEYLQNVGRKLRAEGITTSYQVRTGSAAEEIIKLADESHADVVAMSTHGQSGFSRWEQGSIVEKILRAGNTPLLLVRPRQV
jgi:nucleotide-binding universal stress UspA family protein